MNETIMTPRQRAIIAILSIAESLSREEIAEKLQGLYSVSKATLARDLSELQEGQHIQAIGNGPSRLYALFSSHPLLKATDLSAYFSIDADKRLGAFTSFQSPIFGKLHGLISAQERTELDEQFRSFSQAELRVDESIRKRELERFVIELAWKSSKIEGNTYSLLETERLLKERQEATGHSKLEATMILNHKDAFETILREKDTFRVLTMHTLLELHGVLTKGLGIDNGIRKFAVGITGTAYRPLDNEWQIKENLETLIDLVNKTEYPLEKALIVSSMVAYLQPFADGNKRTARMLANALLLAGDYFPLSYRSVDENEYKSAQLLFDETNNMFHMKRLFLEQYRFALATYFV